MFILLLESLFTFGNVNSNNTKILVYTTTQFKYLIENCHLYDSNIIIFETNDNLNSIDDACKARLDLFNLQSINMFNKILYLDTDIIIKSDINVLFQECNNNILYCLEEGTIDDDRNFWGKSLFNDEVNKYDDKTAFSSGILMFNNCSEIKNLFKCINNDMKIRSHTFHDQPFIVYQAFNLNIYNNKLMKQYAVNNDCNVNSNYIIHHFCGGPGVYQHKIVNMSNFINNLKEDKINKAIQSSKHFIDCHLMPIIKNTNELLEGNIFMFHNTYNYTDLFVNKTKNISNVVLNKNVKNVMEIGFNAGFSTLLMLFTNPNIRVHCFDLGEHKYTLPCFNKIKEYFGNRLEITIGNSVETLMNINCDPFDVIHIDGGHSTEVANSDIVNSLRLSKKGTILIMDDYDFPNLHELWDSYVVKHNLQNLQISHFNSPHHDIKYLNQ